MLLLFFSFPSKNSEKEDIPFDEWLMILQGQSGQPEAGTSKSTDAAEAESRILTELDGKWSCVGDVDGLQKDI